MRTSVRHAKTHTNKTRNAHRRCISYQNDSDPGNTISSVEQYVIRDLWRYLNIVFYYYCIYSDIILPCQNWATRRVGNTHRQCVRKPDRRVGTLFDAVEIYAPSSPPPLPASFLSNVLCLGNKADVFLCKLSNKSDYKDCSIFGFT